MCVCVEWKGGGLGGGLGAYVGTFINSQKKFHLWLNHHILYMLEKLYNFGAQNSLTTFSVQSPKWFRNILLFLKTFI